MEAEAWLLRSSGFVERRGWVDDGVVGVSDRAEGGGGRTSLGEKEERKICSLRPADAKAGSKLRLERGRGKKDNRHWYEKHSSYNQDNFSGKASQGKKGGEDLTWGYFRLPGPDQSSRRGPAQHRKGGKGNP